MEYRTSSELQKLLSCPLPIPVPLGNRYFDFFHMETYINEICGMYVFFGSGSFPQQRIFETHLCCGMREKVAISSACHMPLEA